MHTFKQYLEEQSKIDQIQAALDVAGFEPTAGTTADAANTVISGLRAALAKEPDERKKHIINAGISAISLIPFADVIKVLKLRKSKPAAKLAVQGARGLKTYSKTQQASNRFGVNISEKKEKRRLDPKCWKGYRKAGTKLKDGTRVNKCVKVNEVSVAGALGSAAGGTSQFSSDTYATGDTRVPHSIYGKGGVMSRGGLIKSRKKRKKK